MQAVSGTILSRQSVNSARSIPMREQEQKQMDQELENNFNWDKNMMDEPQNVNAVKSLSSNLKSSGIMHTHMKKFGHKAKQNKLISDIKRETSGLQLAKKQSQHTALNQIIISGKDKGMQNKLIRLTEKMNHIVSERPRAFQEGQLKPKSEVEISKVPANEKPHFHPPEQVKAIKKSFTMK